MPIKPENKNRYPKDWPQISAAVRKRAKNLCEFCGVRNYSVGYRDATGEFTPITGNIICDLAGRGLAFPSLQPITYAKAKIICDTNNENDLNRHYIVVVLTVAHLDHTPENCEPSNLRALCQRCHLSYDAKHHAQTRRADSLKGQRTLF